MSEKIQENKKSNYSSKYLIDQPPITRDDFLSEIVQQFIKRRKDLGLTQDDIDIRMGNADRTCSKWECGHRTPTSFNLLCWAETLNATIQILPK